MGHAFDKTHLSGANLIKSLFQKQVVKTRINQFFSAKAQEPDEEEDDKEDAIVDYNIKGESS